MDYPDKQNQNRQQDIIAKLAEDFIKALKEDELPWSRGFDFQKPWNPSTKRFYSGTIKFFLAFESKRKGYKDPRWMTSKQAQKLGGHVRQGEYATLCPNCVFIRDGRKDIDRKIKSGKPEPTMKDGKPITEKFFAWMPCYLYNVKQIEGLSLPPLQRADSHKWDPNERAETLILNSKAKIVEFVGLPGATASYCFNKDFTIDEIRMPQREQFHDAGSFYGTLLHELCHWTGHPKRLGRFKFDEFDEIGRFGSTVYAREELRAEIGSSLLCATIGVPHDLRNHKAYVQSWSKELKKNPREILYAASAADKIVTYLRQFDPVKDPLLTRSRRSR